MKTMENAELIETIRTSFDRYLPYLLRDLGVDCQTPEDESDRKWGNLLTTVSLSFQTIVTGVEAKLEAYVADHAKAIQQIADGRPVYLHRDACGVAVGGWRGGLCQIVGHVPVVSLVALPDNAAMPFGLSLGKATHLLHDFDEYPMCSL